MAEVGATEAGRAIASYGGKLVEGGKHVYRAFAVANLLRTLPVPVDAHVLFEDKCDDLACLMNSTGPVGGILSALVCCMRVGVHLEEAVSKLTFVHRQLVLSELHTEVKSLRSAHWLNCEFNVVDTPILISNVDFELYWPLNNVFLWVKSCIIVVVEKGKGICFFYDPVLDEVVGFQIESMMNGIGLNESRMTVGPVVSKEDIIAEAKKEAPKLEGHLLLERLGLTSEVPTYAGQEEHFRLDRVWLKSCVSLEGAKTTLSRRNTADLVWGIRLLHRSGLSALLDSFIDELESVVVADEVVKFERRDEIPAVFGECIAANADVERPRSVALPGLKRSCLQVYSAGGYRVVSIPGINKRILVPLGLEQGNQYLSPLHEGELLTVSFLKILKVRSLLPVRTVRAVCRRADESLDFLASPIDECVLRTLPGSQPFYLRKVLRKCQLPEDVCVSVLVWLGADFQRGEGPDYGCLPRALESVVGFNVRKTQMRVVPDCPVRLDVTAATWDKIHGPGLPLRRCGVSVGFLKVEQSLTSGGVRHASFAEVFTQDKDRTIEAIYSSILVGSG